MVGLFGISLVSLSKNWTINSRKDLFRNASQYCSYHNGYNTIKYCKLSKLYRFSLKYILAVRREMQDSWALSVRTICVRRSHPETPRSPQPFCSPSAALADGYWSPTLSWRWQGAAQAPPTGSPYCTVDSSALANFSMYLIFSAVLKMFSFDTHVTNLFHGYRWELVGRRRVAGCFGWVRAVSPRRRVYLWVYSGDEDRGLGCVQRWR